jgi:hypothetical protein
MLTRLPLDLLRYVIRDMLDYESRVCLNRVLPPRDRYCTRLSRDACVDHQVHVSAKTLNSVFNHRNDALDPAQRSACLTTLLERAVQPPHIILLEMKPGFRSVLRTRAEEILTYRVLRHYWLMRITRNARKRLYRAARAALLVCNGFSED